MNTPIPNEAPVSFSEQDLADFSKASGDRNPLHLSREYALCTPYGQQVVFGCLGAIACLGRLALPAHWTITELQAEFLRPMFLSVLYRVEISEKEGSWIVRLFDGSLNVVSITLKTSPGEHISGEEMPGTALFPRGEAAAWKQEDMVPGLVISGQYACDPDALRIVTQRWGADPFLTRVFCWSSYLTGMELPGESALFSKLSLHFDSLARGYAKWEYRASVGAIDPRFGQIRLDVSLSAGTASVASGSCWSFIRPALPEEEENYSAGAGTGSLAGRTVVVIGASRGLGAAMKHALELRGAIVYSLARSGVSSKTPRTEVGDASDPAVLRRLRERILKEQGRLDFLICNACPPILPLRLEENAAKRIEDYISKAVSITLAPLCAFSELLNSSEGCVVIVSSAVVEQPVREWPHYAAAKHAVEMLARVASLQYPSLRTLIVRPPKLLTAMTNTPMARRGAISPRQFAQRIVTRLEDPLEPGKIEVLG